MAVYNLEEQEQLLQIKQWWERNGKWVATIAVSVAVVTAGWQGANWYMNRRSAQASELYFELQTAIEKKDPAGTRAIVGELIDKYSGTPYAERAVIDAAGIQVDEDNAKNAIVQLEWQIEHGNSPILRDIARLQTASVLLNMGQYEEGLTILRSTSHPLMAARFEDLRGDLYAAADNPAQAREAYQKALELLANNNAGEQIGSLVKLKLEMLGS